MKNIWQKCRSLWTGLRSRLTNEKTQLLAVMNSPASQGSVKFDFEEKVDMTNRYSIINRNTSNTRRSVATRALAREIKKDNERIFDNVSGKYVR